MGKKATLISNRSNSSLEDIEDENSEINKHKSAMIKDVLLQTANQKSSQLLTKGLPNTKSLTMSHSHIEKRSNEKNSKTKLQRKGFERVSSSEDSSEESVAVKVKKEISQSSDDNKSIDGLSGTKIEEESVRNSDSDNKSGSGSSEKQTNNTVVKLVLRKSQDKSRAKEKKGSLTQSVMSTRQNEDSEDDDKTIESIEKRILDQTRLDIEQGISANGRLNILQDVQLTPPKAKNPHDQFNRLYPNTKQLSVESPTKFSNKYDYYLFRIPKNIDPQPLLNMEINIEAENKIVCGDKKFIIKPTTKVPSPGLIVPENRILHFKSNIIMEKYVKSKKHPKLESVDKKPFALPTDLKNRHPLFGSNFEDKIELDEEIKRKLDAAISSSLHEEKKSKKKKIKTENQTQDDEVIFNLLNNLGTSSKRKNNTKEPLGQNSKSHTKKESRRTKQGIIDETLKMMKAELLTEYETDAGDRPPHKKKKHKKNITNNDTSIVEIPNIPQDNSEDIWSGLSKKEKRRMSVANSTLMMDISRQPKFDPYINDISTINNIKNKSKKSKRKSDGEKEDT